MTPREYITSILRETFGLAEDYVITDAMRLRDNLNADALDLIEIIVAVEDKFKIQVPDEQVGEAGDDNVSVGDLIALIERLVNV